MKDALVLFALWFIVCFITIDCILWTIFDKRLTKLEKYSLPDRAEDMRVANLAFVADRLGYKLVKKDLP